MCRATLRVELIERDLQLLQQAASVLPADELIVRMIHKLELKAYISQSPSEPTSYRVHAAEMLLRTLLGIVSNRYRPSIGYFDANRLTPLHCQPISAETPQLCSFNQSAISDTDRFTSTWPLSASAPAPVRSLSFLDDLGLKPLIDPQLECEYGQLIEDVVHTLCVRPMAYSELLNSLPQQPTESPLMQPITEEDEPVTSAVRVRQKV
ncbi:unnamed protein product [Protopolystoma xenopodis]|uniref:E3 ubiquitin-protein ligase n=1 Tax=Protopolystoma xenopodis TaxID=117903 RepID=A0A448WNR3_9PLAT|nr:unnamed protein product [Protopolystoma xenopodis]